MQCAGGDFPAKRGTSARVSGALKGAGDGSAGRVPLSACRTAKKIRAPFLGALGVKLRYFRFFGIGSSSYMAVSSVSREDRSSRSSTSNISFAPS